MTRSEFEFFVPSAVMPDDALFERISEHIEEGFAGVERILGAELFADLDKADGNLRTLCNRYASLTAYKLAIPHLDLVLTDNGFGVVSNQNVAPASAERVERLRKTVQNGIDDTLDDLLDCLRGNEKWVATPFAAELFRSLVWNGKKQLFYFGIIEGHRSQLDKLRPKISVAEERVKHCISEEFFNELCDAIRERTATAEQQTAIHKVMLTVGADVSVDRDTARLQVGKLAEWLDGNIRTFPTYANSTAYAANTFAPYRNEKDDPCYFFG